MNKQMLQTIKAEVQRLVKKQREEEIPRKCWYCGWFTPRKKPPLIGNRGCHYPGPIKVVGGIYGECQMWKLELDPKKRKRVLVYG